MQNHYIACVMIIFAAVLATIPTYHEMTWAEPIGADLPPSVYADVYAGAPSSHAGSPAHITIRPGGETVPHMHPGAALIAIEPDRLGWSLVEGTADAARAVAIHAIGPGAASGVAGANLRLAHQTALITK